MTKPDSAIGLNFFEADSPLVDLLKRKIPDEAWE
jgi:hypothetical protein